MTSDNKFKIATKWVYVVGRVLLFSLCCVVILICCSSVARNAAVKYTDHLSILSATIVTFVLILLFLKWEKRKLIDVGVVPGKYSISRFVCGYIIGFMMAASQALIVLFYGHFQLKPVPDISIIDILSPLLLYFFIACREELAFRSYSLRTLNISLGPIIALSTITIIFIIEHVAAGMTLKMAIIGSGAGAILFGVSALKTKGLALSLGLHSAWNFGQWSFGFKNKPGIWQAIVENGYESEIENVGLTAFSFVMGVAIAGLFFYYRNTRMTEYLR
ncbi:CPBP family intramembrane glutamic endopeptidase [Mucilaginibacter sp.]|uniref:CPBP family intramembrane glutamic endopeptidase n=1 Tax=Mucilaginibacter sp. TaxID=1882438 RepID=UPI0035BC221B